MFWHIFITHIIGCKIIIFLRSFNKTNLNNSIHIYNFSSRPTFINVKGIDVVQSEILISEYFYLTIHQQFLNVYEKFKDFHL